MTVGQRNWAVVQRLAAQYRAEQEAAKRPHVPQHTNGKTVVPPPADLGRRLAAFMAKKEPAVQGEYGSNPTYKAACHLVHGFSLSKAEAYPYMAAYSNTCLPPWSEQEIWHKLDQAEARPDRFGRPRGYLLNAVRHGKQVPRISVDEPAEPYEFPGEPEDFPFSSFPDALQGYCLAVQAAKKSPPSYVGCAVLGAAAAALGAARCLRPKDDWNIYGNLWIALVGLSGDSKSPVLEEVMDPVVEIDAELDDANQKEADKFASDLSKWERERKQGFVSPKPKQAPMKALRVDNITVESVIQFLDSNPRGLILYRDELSGWFESMAQYKPGGKGDDRTIYLSLYANQGTKSNRKGQGLLSLRCRKPCFSAIGGMQPSVLRTMNAPQPGGPPNANGVPPREDGLKERLCFAYPPYQPLGLMSRQGMPAAHRGAWRNAIRWLYGLQQQPGTEGRMEAVPVEPTAEAAGILFDWIDATRLEADAAYKDGEHSVRSTWIKITALGGKLALLTHFLREAYGEIEHGTVIDELDVAAGCRLANFFKQHAKKAIAALLVKPDEGQAQSLYQWILHQGGSMSLRDMCRRKPCGLSRKSEILAVCGIMADLGMGNLTETKNPRGSTTTSFTASESVTVSPKCQESVE